MKFKKVMLISFILLAILTISAVSASSDLTAIETPDSTDLDVMDDDLLSSDVKDEDLKSSNAVDEVLETSDSVDEDLSSIDDSQIIESANEEELSVDQVDVISDNDIDDEIISDGDDKQEIEYYQSHFYEEYLITEEKTFGVGIYYWDYATGYISISIDNIEIYNEEVISCDDDWDTGGLVGGNFINLDEYELSFGSHDFLVVYSGDETYARKSWSGSFEYTYKIVHVPEEFYSSESLMSIMLPNNATGDLNVLIDNKPFYTASVQEALDGGNYILLNIYDLAYGSHDYVVSYSNGNYDDFSESGSFEYSYFFLAECYDTDISIGDNVSIAVDLPSDASSLPIASVGGKNYTFNKVSDGHFNIALTDFTLGDNTILVSYQDEKYPLKTHEISVYVDYYFYIPYTVRYNGDDAIILRLPSDANGNLVVTIAEDETKSVKLENGIAKFYFTDLQLDSYYVEASYDGTDYGPIADDGYVTIIPNVNVTRYMRSEGEYNITIECPPDSSSNLNVGLYTAYNPEYDDEWGGELISTLYSGSAAGTKNIPLDISDLDADNWYKIKVAVDDDEPKVYYFKVRSESQDYNLTFNLPKDIMRYASGEGFDYDYYFSCNDADGTITFYLDGNRFSSSQFVYGDCNLFLDFSRASYGQHNWKLTFTNDSYYHDTSLEGTVNVNWCYVPEVVSKDSPDNPNYDSIFIYIAPDEDAVVTVIIDGKESAVDFVKHSEYYYPLSNLSYGVHNYTVILDGNEQLSTSGSFTVENRISLIIGDNEEGEIYYWENLKVEAFVNEDMTGSITFIIDGNDPVTVEIKDGYAFMNAVNLTLGEHTVLAKYSGDSNYAPSNVSKTFVIPENYGILVKNKDIQSSQMDKALEYISLRLPEDAQGSLVIENQDYEVVMSVPLENGYAKISASDFENGDQYFHIYYSGDDYIINDVYSFIKVGPVIDYDVPPAVGVGFDGYVYVFIEGASGNLIVYLDDEKIANQSFSSSIANVSFETKNLQFGEHTIKFEYEGDDYPNVLRHYDEDIGEVVDYVLKSFNIAPQDVSIAFTNPGVYFEMPEDAKGYMEVYIDHELYKNETVSGANPSVSIDGLKPGYYNVGFKYVDEKYGVYDLIDGDWGLEIYAHPEITVETPESKIPTIVVKVSEDATGSVFIVIDGKKYIQKLNNSMATFELPDLADGTYDIKVVYSGGEYVASSEANKTITIGAVTPAPTVPAKIVAKDYSAYYNKGTYSVTVYGTDGKVAKGVSVVFKINGKKVATVKTDSKGVAKLKIAAKYVPKTYKISATALGKTVTKKLVVKQVLKLKKVKVKRSAKKLVITATLKEGKKAIKGKKITFRFKGKKYTAKTNKKGIAKITIKKKVLKKLKAGKKVKYQATYLKDTVKRTVKVKK